MSKLVDQLVELQKSDMLPLHMPGHKRKSIGGVMGQIYGIDITEIDGFDDLHHPEEILMDMQRDVANIYGANNAFISINGSTVANEAAILATCRRGDKILVPRASHKSIYYGVQLAGAVPVYLPGEYLEGSSIISPITPEQVRTGLEANPDCKSVIVTSPTYEGVCANIQEIASVCHENNVILIVDSAHGAHLGISDKLPRGAMELGADIVAVSLHKMLPAPTQTALLLTNTNQNIDESVAHYMDILQSSSPSYVLLAGIAECIEYLKTTAKTDIDRMVDYVYGMRNKLNKLYSISIEDSFDVAKNNGFSSDPAKIIIHCKSGIHTGRQLYDILRNDYHIQCEMCGPDYVLAMMSPVDDKDAFERLESALLAIDDRSRDCENKHIVASQSSKIRYNDSSILSIPEYVMSQEEAITSEKKAVKCTEAVGCIVADFVLVYPPGIPILVPGEKITSESINYLCQAKDLELNIYGMNDGMLKVVI